MTTAILTTINLEEMGKAARVASRKLATLTTDKKNQALLAIADELETQAQTIIAQNVLDLADGRTAGLSASLLDRMLLNEARINNLAADTRKVVDLPDPVGAEIEGRVLPNGLRLSRRRIPIGVLGVIYEARPNVTIDIATLCLKTGNAVIMRGGKEILRSNVALINVINAALERVGLPTHAIQYIDNPDRAFPAPSGAVIPGCGVTAASVICIPMFIAYPVRCNPVDGGAVKAPPSGG